MGFPSAGLVAAVRGFVGVWVRGSADGYPGAAIWSLQVEVMVGLAWFVLALADLHTFTERGRANGLIVLSE